MAYLKRVEVKPNPPAESIGKRFDANEYELNIQGGRVEWDVIDEVEVAKAARVSSPAGWFVKKIMYSGGERYHVGVFFGRAANWCSPISPRSRRATSWRRSHIMPSSRSAIPESRGSSKPSNRDPCRALLLSTACVHL